MAGKTAAAEAGSETEAPPPAAVQLRLPRMARFKVPEIALRFGGSIVQRLTSEDDVKMAETFDLGGKGTVTFQPDGGGPPLVLAYRVADTAGGFVKPAGQDEIVRGRRKIVIGDGAVEDDPEDD